MVHYRVYARNTLEYIDGGVVKDYSIDYDIISNNTSTASIIDTSMGFKELIFFNSFVIFIITNNVKIKNIIFSF